jgi:hypothetical protein
MAYLDTILSAAMQGPSDEDKDTLRRLSRIAGSSNYNPTPDIAAQGPQNYSTPLSATEEPAFQNWLKTNQIPYKDEPQADYDMRGFYKAAQFGDPRATQSLNAGDQQMHFPDTWKTPYHTGFSNESMYAPQSAPRWEEDVLKSAGGKVVSDERPSQPQTPLGGYLGAIGATAPSVAAPREEALPARTPPERAYPPAEGTGYEGFQVPPPSAISQRLNAIAEQEAALKYPGAHDISQKRRYLADLAGVGIGILSKNPMAGIQMAEGIKTQDFRRKFADLERQREAWTPRETEEQKRTTEAANIYKAERTADISQQRVDIGQTAEVRKGKEDVTKADEFQQKEERIRQNENIVATWRNQGLISKEQEAAINRRFRADEDEKNRVAAQKRAETMATGQSGRIAEAKEASPDEKQAADNAAEIIKGTNDPSVKENVVSLLPPKAKAYFEAKHKDAAGYKKLTTTQKAKLDATKISLDLINQVSELAQKNPKMLGPVVGRVINHQGALGVAGSPESEMHALLTRLITSDASAAQQGRVSHQILEFLQKQGEAGIASNPSQFFGRLKGMMEADKTTYRDVSGTDYVYTPPSGAVAPGTQKNYKVVGVR